MLKIVEKKNENIPSPSIILADPRNYIQIYILYIYEKRQTTEWVEIINCHKKSLAMESILSPSSFF